MCARLWIFWDTEAPHPYGNGCRPRHTVISFGPTLFKKSWALGVGGLMGEWGWVEKKPEQFPSTTDIEPGAVECAHDDLIIAEN